MLSAEAADVEAELAVFERFRRDLAGYSAACLQIRTKSARMQPLLFNRAQRLVHERLEKQREEVGRVRAWVLKARQEGVSTYVAGRFFHRTTLWRNQAALVIADKDDRAGKLWDIYDRYHRHLPVAMKPQLRYTGKRSHLLFDTDDEGGLGSEIAVTTARDPHAGRATTIQNVHASEIAFWRDPEDTWISLMQAVPDDASEVVGESTANGVGNFFHREWEAAESGESGWLAIFLPWWIHEEYVVNDLDNSERDEILQTLSDWERHALEQGIPWEGEQHRLSPGHLAWRRRTIREKLAGDERAFRQEYPATADEAFLVSGNCFFDEEKVAEYAKRAALTPAVQRGNMLRVGVGIAFRPAERGWVRLWERPEPSGHYVVGADTAEGRQVSARDTSFADPEAERGGRDFCSGDVLRVGHWQPSGVDEQGNPLKVWVPPRLVAQLHGRMAPEVFAEQLNMLGRWYSCPGPEDQRTLRRPAIEAVERNHSSGETVLRKLREEHRYPTLFHHRRILDRRGQRHTKELGWITSHETRGPMLDELAEAVRRDRIEVPCAESVREMLTFVRAEDGRPEAQEGCHDDRVISLAISLQMALHHHSCGVPGESKRPLPEVEVADTPTGL